jgi:hypothetical protein
MLLLLQAALFSGRGPRPDSKSVHGLVVVLRGYMVVVVLVLVGVVEQGIDAVVGSCCSR